MSISSFILKRIFLSIFVIFGLSILIFIIARVAPGDPARMSLGPRAPEEVVQRLREEMHLDKNLVTQYFYWIKGVLSGNFGRSLSTERDVILDIKDYLPATLEIALFSGVLMVIFGILLGTIAAQYKNTWIDGMIRLLSYFGVAIPGFVLAVFFILIFGHFWPILPVMGRLSPGIVAPDTITGLFTVDSLIQGNYVAFWDALKHITLPSIALVLGRIFQDARITRSSMIDNMSRDFLAAERGYGIPERVIMFKYLLKLSLIPTVAMMGIEFATLLSKAFLVEMIFNWPGISRYGIHAMLEKDLNAISAVIITFGIILTLMNIIVDIVVAYLDPRVRLT